MGLIMYYRIKQRKHSSNILERSIDNKNWEPFIAPLVNKTEGDILTDGLFKFYVNKEILKG